MKTKGVVITILAGFALYVLLFRKPGSGPPPPGPSQPQDLPGSDLGNYPIHGAPAIQDLPGSHTNVLASYPSLITGSSSTSTATTPSSVETTPAQTVNQQLGKWALGQGFIAAESGNRQATLAEQAQVPGLAGVGLAGSNASGGFGSAGARGAGLVDLLSGYAASLSNAVISAITNAISTDSGAGHMVEID